MSVETMQAQLRKLQLGTAAREIEEVLSKYKKSVSLDWVSELLEREIDSRKERASPLTETDPVVLSETEPPSEAGFPPA